LTSPRYDVVVIGGGIIGLSSALQLLELRPNIKVAVLEKESELAAHQTGHNSGVIHSGIYYKPDSQKAKFCTSGVYDLKKYCVDKNIKYDECGKVIVATTQQELTRLKELYKRGMANGVPDIELIGRSRLAELEPYANGIQAIYSPHTAIVDFRQIATAYSEDIQLMGGHLLLDHQLKNVTVTKNDFVLSTSNGPVITKNIINCAGLYADKVADMMGVHNGIKIIPFRGEYFIIRPERRKLVKGLIYPVPDPRFPFLGVHYTKRINGEVEAGPNAVFAWSREGYKTSSINPRETLEYFAYLGFWRMAISTWKVGLSELHRSIIKSVFVKDLQKLIPEIQSDDLLKGGSGVRAQAVDRKGNLLDDFNINITEGAIHVLNAPSPGATSSMSIGRHIARLAYTNFKLNY